MKDDVPMIEQYKVDAVMAYACRIVRDVKIIIAIVMAAVIAIVYIFVSKYNMRTSEWLKTIAEIRQTTVAEVQDGKTEAVQQFPSEADR